MPWTSMPGLFLLIAQMTETSLIHRVPVSTTASHVHKDGSNPLHLVGANQLHQSRVVGVLVHTYGWILGQDGNLYAPDASMAWGERVA